MKHFKETFGRIYRMFNKKNHGRGLSSFSSQKKPLFYGWYIVLVGLVVLTLNALAVFRGIGVLVVVLQKNFAWSRTQISIGNVLSRAEGAALGPIEGFLIDKIGAKRMLLIGMTIMGLGFVAFSRIQTVWQFYIVFLIITLGAGLGGWLAIASLLNNWFVKKTDAKILPDCTVNCLITCDFIFFRN